MDDKSNVSWDGFSLKKKRDVPEGLWRRCPQCEDIIFARAVDENLGVCPECQHHFRISARRRIEQLCDEGSFEELMTDCAPTDALKFTDSEPYSRRLRSLQKKTGLTDAAVMGKGFVKGRPLILAALDPDFMMGSMGSVVGEKVSCAAEEAVKMQLPLVIVSCSGGARMQEGALSLGQMAKTSAAVGRLHKENGLFISILADPTSGGVAASFAMLGDVIIAEPGALICFAGPRTIWHTIKVELPDGFQKAEFLLDHGFVDMITERKELRSEIARIIDYCGK